MTDTTNHRMNELPVKGKLYLFYGLSLAVAVLTAAASLGGILLKGNVYPSEDLLNIFLANDFLNLLVGLPALLISIWLARRGRLVGLLLWPGALIYFFYTYLIYIFTLPLNPWFLLHLSLVTLSGYAMIGLTAQIRTDAIQKYLSGRVGEKWGGGALAGLGFLFLLRVIGILAGSAFSGKPLPGPEQALAVVDFLISPAWFVGGILLWRQRPFGYTAGLGLLFQACTLILSLVFFLILQPFLTGSPFLPVDTFVVALFFLICCIPFALFLRGVMSENREKNGKSKKTEIKKGDGS